MNNIPDISQSVIEDSGIKYNFLNKQGMPMYIRCLFNAGSLYDTKLGISHFLEHMIIAGTERFPTKDKLSEYIENAGGEIGLTTNTDHISINFEIANSKDLTIVTTLLDEMLHKSLFDEQTIENERGAILQEYKNKKTNQQQYAFEVQKRLFFQQSPFDKPVLGTLESIKSITKNDLVDFKDTFLSYPVSVMVAGDVDPKNFIAQFKSVIKKPSIKIDQPNFKILQPRTYTDFEEYNSEIIDLVIGFPTSQQNLIEKISLDILMEYLGGGRSSFLSIELRYKRGLVYSVNASNIVYGNRGMFYIITRCTRQNLKETSEKIQDALLTIKKNFSQELLEQYKKRISNYLTIKLQTSKSWVEQMSVLSKVTNSPSIAEYIDCLNTISFKNIQETIDTHFKKQLFVAACGPKEAKEIIESLNNTL